MIAKVNVEIELLSSKKVTVELWDVDVIQDDRIDAKFIENSGMLEFIFSTDKSGEINPELQIRIKDENGSELFRSPANNTLNAYELNSITGFLENSTISFDKIVI